MRRQTFGSTGRRGTVIAASAAVLCLGGALAACGTGTGDGDGYVAVGAAGTGREKAPTGPVAPSGKVTLIPLDGSGSDGGGGARPKPRSSAKSGGAGNAGSPGDTGDGTDVRAQIPGPSGAAPSGGTSGGTTGTTGSASGSGGGGAGGAGGTSGTGGASGTGPGGAGSGSPGSSTPSAPGTTAPAGPAALTLGAPERAAADDRWCEKVTVEFRNTGGSRIRSGTVTFATHIIGALGIDWATVETTAPLPAPIDAGAARKKTYTVCVDAWRVPLGMHVETRDVTAVWK